MTATTKIGIAVVFAGVILFVFGFVKFETHEEIFRFGGFQATNTTQTTIPSLRYAGLALSVAGVALGCLGRKRPQG